MLELELLKNNNLIKACLSYTKKEIDECCKNEKFKKEVYKKAAEILIFNKNIDIEYYKYIYDKYNIKFSQKDIANSIIASIYDDRTSNNFIEKMKYVLEQNITDLNTFVAEDLDIVNYCVRWCMPLKFIKYLIEDKHVKYNDKIVLKYLPYWEKSSFEILKYFVETLKISKNDDLVLFEVVGNLNIDIFKYLVEKHNYNPKIVNENNENLLFEVVSTNIDSEQKKEMFKYLVKKYGLDVNAKSKTGNTVIFMSLQKAKIKDDNFNYLWVEYLLKNYQIKIDKNLLNTISNIFKK